MTASGPLVFSPGGSYDFQTSAQVAASIAASQTAQDVAMVAAGRLLVSARNYGVMGDGVTDDTAAINAMLVAVGVGTFFFPEGTYVVSGAIAVAAGQYIIGEGAHATIFAVNHVSADIFTFSGGTHIEGAGIRNFQIKSLVTRSGGRYIYAATSLMFVVEDFTMQGAWIGIELAGTVQYVNRGHIRDSIATNGIGILISGGGDHHLSNIVMDKPSGTKPAAGIKITDSGGSMLHNMDILRQINGILINPGSGQAVQWCNFSDIYADTCTTACWNFTTSGTGTINGIAMANCWGASSTLYGLFTNGAGGIIDGITLSNFRCVNNGTEGIHLGGVTKNFTMNGGLVGGNSIGTPLTYAGINLAASTVTGTVISGVKIGAVGALGDTHAIGISLANTIDYVAITGCMLATAQIAIAYSGIGTSVYFRDNIGFRNEAHGPGKIDSGSASKAITHGLSFTPLQSDIMITPTTDIALSTVVRLWVSAVSSTTFTVTANGVASADLFFGWTVKSTGAQ